MMTLTSGFEMNRPRGKGIRAPSGVGIARPSGVEPRPGAVAFRRSPSGAGLGGAGDVD
jgi:hypothetical protein